MGVLDSNPRSIAAILFALGLFGVGVILTFGFFNDSTLLGVGVTMIVLGAAGLLLGVIHLCAQDQSGRKKSKEQQSIAPPRVPKEVPRIRGEPEEDDPEGELYYEPCSVSPPRGDRGLGMLSPNRAGGLIVPNADGVDALSPYDKRSFPVPVVPRGETPGKVVVESVKLDYAPYDAAGASPSQALRQRLANRLEAPHPAEQRFREGGDFAIPMQPAQRPMPTTAGAASPSRPGYRSSSQQSMQSMQSMQPLPQFRVSPNPRPLDLPFPSHGQQAPQPGGAGWAAQGGYARPLPVPEQDRRRFTDGQTPARLHSAQQPQYIGPGDDAFSPEGAPPPDGRWSF